MGLWKAAGTRFSFLTLASLVECLCFLTCSCRFSFSISSSVSLSDSSNLAISLSRWRSLSQSLTRSLTLVDSLPWVFEVAIIEALFTSWEFLRETSPLLGTSPKALRFFCTSLTGDATCLGTFSFRAVRTPRALRCVAGVPPLGVGLVFSFLEADLNGVTGGEALIGERSGISGICEGRLLGVPAN